MELEQIAPGLRAGPVGAQEIRVERDFAATPEAVFGLLTTPELIGQWWPPEGTTAVVERLELVPGGGWSMTAQEAGGASTRLFGTYVEVNPPWTYVQTFESDAGGHLWVEAVSLRPQGEGTLATNVGIMASTAARDQSLGAGMHEVLRLGYERMKASVVPL
jgi:uncharacterized protein YndB with AHSA1/START domain